MLPRLYGCHNNNMLMDSELNLPPNPLLSQPGHMLGTVAIFPTFLLVYCRSNVVEKSPLPPRRCFPVTCQQLRIQTGYWDLHSPLDYG
jgi:hypothetical protein